MKRSAVAAQYERYPYPRVPLLALPDLASAYPLSYELGQYLRTGRFIPHDENTRILVAGCGDFEPLVVARAHPRARVTALDLSLRSLRRLRLRTLAAGVSGRLDFVQAELRECPELGQFDYILCTGVLHHSETPAELLAALRSRLKPHGLLRVMTYAPHSRGWVYETSAYLKAKGITAGPRVLSDCRSVLAELAPSHPFRTTFENYGDARSVEGAIDGFFHAYDQPIALAQLRADTEALGLKLIGFGHARHSQPAALAEALRSAGAPEPILERFAALDAWQRLEALDALFELTVNPVLWFAPEPEAVTLGVPERIRLNPPLELAARESRRTSRERNCEELVVSGSHLGEDGALPAELWANRCLTTEPVTPAAPTSQKRHIRERQVVGLRRAFELLGMWEHPGALAALTQVLEPRVSRSGAELPWLSSGDLLRDLYSRFNEPVAILRFLREYAGRTCAPDEAATRW